MPDPKKNRFQAASEGLKNEMSNSSLPENENSGGGSAKPNDPAPSPKKKDDNQPTRDQLLAEIKALEKEQSEACAALEGYVGESMIAKIKTMKSVISSLEERAENLNGRVQHHEENIDMIFKAMEGIEGGNPLEKIKSMQKIIEDLKGLPGEISTKEKELEAENAKLKATEEEPAENAANKPIKIKPISPEEKPQPAPPPAPKLEIDEREKAAAAEATMMDKMKEEMGKQMSQFREKWEEDTQKSFNEAFGSPEDLRKEIAGNEAAIKGLDKSTDKGKENSTKVADNKTSPAKK